MVKKIKYTKEFDVLYKLEGEGTNRMLHVEIPKIGEKSTQLGNSSPESLARILASNIFFDLENK